MMIRTMKVHASLTVVLTLVVVLTGGCTPASSDSPEPASNGVAAEQESAESGAETDVSGMPEDFPSDVPVHPGTVTAYEPMQVTDSTTVYQLSVESNATFDKVTEWYQNSLPAGWSVGYFEDLDGEGTEAKIALDGGSYTPADPGGVGGGVLVGVDTLDETTLIVTTVTVMETP